MNDFPWHNNTTIGERWPSPKDYTSEESPFQRDPQGRIKSPTAISKFIRENQSKARTMCKLAGEPTSAWFDENPK